MLGGQPHSRPLHGERGRFVYLVVGYGLVLAVSLLLSLWSITFQDMNSFRKDISCSDKWYVKTADSLTNLLQQKTMNNVTKLYEHAWLIHDKLTVVFYPLHFQFIFTWEFKYNCLDELLIWVPICIRYKRKNLNMLRPYRYICEKQIICFWCHWTA